jgi:type II secretion system protein J
MKINPAKNMSLTDANRLVGRAGVLSFKRSLRTPHSHPSPEGYGGQAALRTSTAFTLIEMILAIGVAAIVIGAISAVFFSALHLREVTQAAVDNAAPLDQALTVLRRDLQSAVPPAPDGILTGNFKVGNVTSTGLSQPVAIELFTTTGVLHANEPWGDIQRVTYVLKNSAAAGGDLVRSVTRNLLSATTLNVQEQPLLSGVASVKFLCLDGAQWVDTWDTTGATSVNTNLPAAVRVQIQMAGNHPNLGPVEIIVPIDSQSRTNA